MEIFKEIIDNSTSSDGDLQVALCEKCGTPRQTIKEFLGRKRLLPIACQCKREEILAEEMKEKRRLEQERLSKIALNSLLSPEMRAKNFDNWDFELGNNMIYSTATKYVAKADEMIADNIGLLMIGSVGNGKSFTACCIANALVDKGVSVIFCNFDAILNRIKSTFNSKEDEYSILKTLNSAQLLVLDDLGTETISEWSKSKLYNIVDYRYREKKTTIVTTNLSQEQLISLYGDRTFDRLREMCVPLKFRDKSFREEKAVETRNKYKELMSK